MTNSQKKPEFGVYLTPTGQLRIFQQGESENGQERWEIDEGTWQKHAIFRCSYPVVKSLSIGWPVLEDRACLKNCEYLGEL